MHKINKLSFQISKDGAGNVISYKIEYDSRNTNLKLNSEFIKSVSKGKLIQQITQLPSTIHQQQTSESIKNVVPPISDGTSTNTNPMTNNPLNDNPLNDNPLTISNPGIRVRRRLNDVLPTLGKNEFTGSVGMIYVRYPELYGDHVWMAVGTIVGTAGGMEEYYDEHGHKQKIPYGHVYVLAAAHDIGRFGKGMHDLKLFPLEAFHFMPDIDSKLINHMFDTGEYPPHKYMNRLVQVFLISNYDEKIRWDADLALFKFKIYGGGYEGYVGDTFGTDFPVASLFVKDGLTAVRNPRQPPSEKEKLPATMIIAAEWPVNDEHRYNFERNAQNVEVYTHKEVIIDGEEVIWKCK